MAKNINGDILRKKGDLFKVDCSVTGTNYGTDSDPKFPLNRSLKKTFFNQLQI